MVAVNHMQDAHTQEGMRSALESNVDAVRAVAHAVEGTIGSKGLDTMLVDQAGNAIITNDGATILGQMEIHHPAARLLIHAARTQKEAVGDGTTTATVIAAAMVEEGARQIGKGVPVTKVTDGIAEATRYVLAVLDASAEQAVSDDVLYRLAMTAGRQKTDVADAVIRAVHLVGRDRAASKDASMADWITSQTGVDTDVTEGVTFPCGEVNHVPIAEWSKVRIAIFDDALEMTRMERDMLRSEAGVQRYLVAEDAFRRSVAELVKAGVGLVLTDRGVDPMAEAILTEANILVVPRVEMAVWKRVASYTNARPMRRTALACSPSVWQASLGEAESIVYDEVQKQIRIAGGQGEAMATIVVGASTEALAAEKKRIAEDAVSAVQNALRGGWVAGGGATEVMLAQALGKRRSEVHDMTGYGMDAVRRAILEPVYRMIHNAGYHPLDKTEEVMSCQIDNQANQYGFDCDSGKAGDMVALGVIDSALVKRQAIRTASEVASAVLKINAIVRMKPQMIEDRYE